MTEALELKSDAELITAVRSGDSDAYGELYERHLVAAKRAAAFLANTSAEREDLVADAFTRVLRALRDGQGPRVEFRAYLLVTMRNAAISTTRGAVVSLYADVPEPQLPSVDPVLDRWQAAAAVDAFASLPERWRMVLWHTEVEDESPATIAPLLGMRPNGVAALAYRAREGLRQAYLRMHLTDVEGKECRATVSKLAGWVRRSVPMPLGRKITKHLNSCPDCRDRAATLTTVNDELRAYLAPLVLGAPLAAAYLAAPAAAGVTSAVAAKAVAVKAVAVKTSAAVAIAAVAMTTVASAPPPVPAGPIPALTRPYSSMSAIIGPPATQSAIPARTTHPVIPPTPPATVPATPARNPAATETPAPPKKDRPKKDKPKKDKPKKAKPQKDKPDKPKKPPPPGPLAAPTAPEASFGTSVSRR